MSVNIITGFVEKDIVVEEDATKNADADLDPDTTEENAANVAGDLDVASNTVTHYVMTMKRIIKIKLLIAKFTAERNLNAAKEDIADVIRDATKNTDAIDPDVAEENATNAKRHLNFAFKIA